MTLAREKVARAFQKLPNPKSIVSVMLFLITSVSCYSQEIPQLEGPSRIALRVDSPFSKAMLDLLNRQTDKQLDVRAHNHGEFDVVVGGQARLSFLAAKTNSANQFGYLGRFPGDFTDTTASDVRILHANTHMTAHVNSWANVYGELLFSDVFTFPSHKQGSLQVRQAYAVLGDKEQSDWYLFLGKKNVSFGDMGTLSPFSQSVVWHYFGALAEGVGVGIDREGFNANVTAVNGGRGIRAADSEAKGRLNNLAANAKLRRGDEYRSFEVGAGFLLGTIYDGNVAEHLDEGQFGDLNSAWDLNAVYHCNGLSVGGEFATTTGPWPVTDHRVMAWKIESGWESTVMDHDAIYSVSWSEGIQGSSGTEFEFNKQLVVGVGVNLGSRVDVSFEYVRSLGFAPLIDITTASNAKAIQNSFVGGLNIHF